MPKAKELSGNHPTKEPTLRQELPQTTFTLEEMGSIVLSRDNCLGGDLPTFDASLENIKLQGKPMGGVIAMIVDSAGNGNDANIAVGRSAREHLKDKTDLLGDQRIRAAFVRVQVEGAKLLTTGQGGGFILVYERSDDGLIPKIVYSGLDQCKTDHNETLDLENMALVFIMSDGVVNIFRDVRFWNEIIGDVNQIDALIKNADVMNNLLTYDKPAEWTPQDLQNHVNEKLSILLRPITALLNENPNLDTQHPLIKALAKLSRDHLIAVQKEPEQEIKRITCDASMMILKVTKK